MKTEEIKAKGKCCACGKPLRNSEHINIIALDRRATWEHPRWGNVLLKLDGYAVAFLCDKCVKQGKCPKYAVEFKGNEIIYHKIDELEKISELEKFMLEG